MNIYQRDIVKKRPRGILLLLLCTGLGVALYFQPWNSFRGRSSRIGGAIESHMEKTARWTAIRIGTPDGGRVVKTDEEWRAILSDEAFRVTRGMGTERPFCGAFWGAKGDGVYVCICCGLPLFDSDANSIQVPAGRVSRDRLMRPTSRLSRRRDSQVNSERSFATGATLTSGTCSMMARHQPGCGSASIPQP